jgi:cysteine-rich repeat protein
MDIAVEVADLSESLDLATPDLSYSDLAPALDLTLPPHCGNGMLEKNLGEVCDDGNTVSGDGCSSDCLSNETCGNGYVDTVKGEVCDDGNRIDGDGCSANCLSNETCGNGYADGILGEVCDNGAPGTGGCSANCKTGLTCGNGIIDPGEICDDGNTVSGDGCSSDCLSNETCGNGYVDVAKSEVCDDDNTNACGICSSNCKAAQPSAKASGSLGATAGSDMHDGETLVLSDGHRSITLEFDVSSTGSFNGVVAPHIAVQANSLTTSGDSGAMIASRIVTAINGAGIDITASPISGANLSLVNNVSGSAGNVAIGSTIATPNFIVNGMSGGSAFDCDVGIGCAQNADCSSGICDFSIHKCKAPSCSDSIRNGDETGPDCGGSCPKCASGIHCFADSDCASGKCQGRQCM